MVILHRHANKLISEYVMNLTFFKVSFIDLKRRVYLDSQLIHIVHLLMIDLFSTFRMCMNVVGGTNVHTALLTPNPVSIA